MFFVLYFLFQHQFFFSKYNPNDEQDALKRYPTIQQTFKMLKKLTEDQRNQMKSDSKYNYSMIIADFELFMILFEEIFSYDDICSFFGSPICLIGLLEGMKDGALQLTDSTGLIRLAIADQVFFIWSSGIINHARFYLNIYTRSGSLSNFPSQLNISLHPTR